MSCQKTERKVAIMDTKEKFIFNDFDTEENEFFHKDFDSEENSFKYEDFDAKENELALERLPDFCTEVITKDDILDIISKVLGTNKKVLKILKKLANG
jgi:hypothetical protein